MVTILGTLTKLGSKINQLYFSQIQIQENVKLFISTHNLRLQTVFAKILTMESGKWEYDDFEKSLVAFKKGDRFLPTSDSLPDFIQLAPKFHNYFNGLRMDTENDRVESYGLITHPGSGNSLEFSNPVLAWSFGVDPNLILEEIQKVKQEGAESIIDVHSHTSEEDFSIFGISSSILPKWLRKKLSDRWTQFSVSDFTCILRQESNFPGMFLVDGPINMLALKTRESESTLIPNNYPAMDKFNFYWYKRFGLDRNLISKVKNLPRFINLLMKPLTLNLAIAKHHHLAFYKGNINEDLIRIYPPIK